MTMISSTNPLNPKDKPTTSS